MKQFIGLIFFSTEIVLIKHVNNFRTKYKITYRQILVKLWKERDKFTIENAFLFSEMHEIGNKVEERLHLKN